MKEAKCRIYGTYNAIRLPRGLNAIGGEPLAGSGFETEEPESGFSATERG